MTKEIQLTQGKVALVDDEDFEYLNQWQWSILTSGYARRRDGIKAVLMHREIMNAPDGMFVDHKNMNTLDNRKSNLRICTKSQNQANTLKNKMNTSGYKGVYKKNDTNWTASISNKGKSIHLGNFSNAVDAAKAYDKAATEIYGEFANTNF